MTVTRIGELDVRECRELLAGGEVGRIALCTTAGPQIVPVSYVVDGASVVFRTTPYGVLGRHASRSRVAFEVDEIDRGSRVGWSVVATGRASIVEEAAEVALIRAFRDPTPWAEGSRVLYVRLVWDTITGRRVRGRGGEAARPGRTP
jgi:nitroimidazol reductase NimA-like FMN-containing flavoprotein (pyridoxamine 5'-phosphate oxidase superfamily)